ncbi:YLS8, partial [Symbiodinium necroappetens]
MATPLQRLSSTYLVEQAVLGEQSKVVCLRFGQDFSPECMKMDEVLSSAAQAVEPGCSIYAVDVREVPECISEFQLTSPAQLIFFFRGKPLELDLGAGPQKKVEFTLSSRQEFLDLAE